MFKWEIKAEKTTAADPKDIWDIWKDVQNWPSWDSDLEWGRLDGEFKKGATGTLKPKGFFASKFTITELVPHVEHTETTRMPMTSIVFSHRIEKTGEGPVKVVHNLKVAGLLAPLLGVTMRLKLKNTIPDALNALINKAEGL